MNNTTLDTALEYANRGWHVFPVQPSPNKKPLIEKGFLGATVDHATIISWWGQWPSAQIGVACGISGIVCLDLDEKPEQGVSGNTQLEQLEAELGSLGCGLEMRTPRNYGRQLFFANPDMRFRRRLGVRKGIDVLGEGGYSILPSPASPGRMWRYGEFTDMDDLVEVPDEWIDLFGGERPQAPTRDKSGAKEMQRPMPIAQNVEEDIRAALAFVSNDERGDWIRIGMALKSTGAGEQAYRIWEDWSKATPSGSVHPKFDEEDQRYQWSTLVVTRADASEVALSTLFYMAMEGGYSGTVHGDDAPAIVIEEAAVAAAAADFDAPLTTNNSITLSDWQDVAAMPPIDWLVDQLIPEQSIVLLGGDSQAGKSFLSIDLAMRIVHGMPFQGYETVPGNVLYLAGEGQAGMASRFRAWKARHRGEELGNYCIVSSEIPVLSKRTMNTLHELVKTVAKWKDKPPDLVVIDTLSQGLEDDENDASVISPIIRGLMALRRRWGCTILIVHHLSKANHKGKGGAPAPTIDSVRGSSALTRNTDAVLGLVVDGHAGRRHLHVWKQKDGEKPEPIPMWLLPVDTGRVRDDGYEETSCIMIPDASTELVEEAQAKAEAGKPTGAAESVEKKLEAHRAKIEQIVEAAVALGAVQGPGSRGAVSGRELLAQVTGKNELLSAALKGAARDGKLVNVGTERAPKWLVPLVPAVPPAPFAIPTSSPLPLPTPPAG